MAKSKNDAPEIYLVTFEGQYICGNAQSTDLERYEITVAMDEGMVDGKQTSAQSVFKGSLAAELMPLKYPKYQGLYTYHIKSAETVSGAEVPFISLKNRIELREMIEEKGLPVEHELYLDNDALREAVKLAEKDPDAFKMQQDRLKENRGVKLAIRSRALEMNGPVMDLLRSKQDVNAGTMSEPLQSADEIAAAEAAATKAAKGNGKGKEKDPAADI